MIELLDSRDLNITSEYTRMEMSESNFNLVNSTNFSLSEIEVVEKLKTFISILENFRLSEHVSFWQARTRFHSVMSSKLGNWALMAGLVRAVTVMKLFASFSFQSSQSSS